MFSNARLWIVLTVIAAALAAVLGIQSQRKAKENSALRKELVQAERAQAKLTVQKEELSRAQEERNRLARELRELKAFLETREAERAKAGVAAPLEKGAEEKPEARAQAQGEPLLVGELAKLRGALEKIHSSLSEQLRERKDLAEQFEALRAELSGVEDARNVLVQERERAEAKYAKELAARKALEREKALLEERYREELANLRVSLEQAKEALSREEARQGLGSELASLREELRKERESWDKRLREAVLGEKRKMEGKVGELESALQKARDELARERDKGRALSDKLAGLAAELSKNRASLARLEEEKSLAQSFLQREQASSRALLAEKEKLKQALDREQSARATLEKKLESLSGELKRTKSWLSEAKALSERLAFESRARASEVEKLREVVSAVEKGKEEELSRLKKSYEGMVKNLKGELERREVEVSRFKDMLSIRIVNRVLFPSGQVYITAKGRQALRKVAGFLRELKGGKILVQGHTDNMPLSEELKQRFPSNWELSTARAAAVARYLQRLGLEPERFVALGYGPYRPVASNDTEEGRALNRRIEIVLTALPLSPAERAP